MEVVAQARTEADADAVDRLSVTDGVRQGVFRIEADYPIRTAEATPLPSTVASTRDSTRRARTARSASRASTSRGGRVTGNRAMGRLGERTHELVIRTGNGAVDPTAMKEVPAGNGS